MSKNREQGKKDFLIAARKKTGPGLTNVPVWILQKAGKRIWNKKAKRHWRETDFGNQYRKLKRGSGKLRQGKGR